MLQSKLGAAIRKCRVTLGLTQEELAWRADLHRTYIADVERGGRNITLKSIANLANALQISVDGLLAKAGEVEGASGERAKVGQEEALAEILLVEDNATDAELAMRAFKRAKFANPIHLVGDGEEAINFLFATGPHKRRKASEVPKLILLDLKLPGMSGVEVLRAVKADKRTQSIPVIVLTGSQHDRDILECGRLGAENYIVKPVRFENLSLVTPRLNFRWAMLEPGTTTADPYAKPRSRKA